ncbi:MAG: response regulator, partial [Nitrospiraceae bacterium]|nr:response regulator [Nitrospiraceae bacterium]
ERTPHDVCLLDYHLGERTGIELLPEMRAHGHDLPVILLTGLGSLETDLEAMEMGAFAYLEKGDLNPVLLERSIRYAMENHGIRAALRRANEELEQRVRERTAELRRSNQDLEQFAKNVARDLQEPLHALTKQLKRMKTQQQEAATPQPSNLNPLLAAAHNMELLVRCVLDYSREGRERRAFEPVELSAVIGDVCAELDVPIRDADAQFDIGPMPTVHGDPSLLKGLFENLFDNALKYRGEHPLEIHVTSERRGDMWLCAVRDNGIGIDMEEGDEIFLMFRRGNNEPERAGIGIGLAICRKILQYHGGRIWADSEPGKGCTVFFTFPHPKKDAPKSD